MVRVTVCPHYLVELPTDKSAQYIELNYISPLLNCVTEAVDRKIDIFLSKEILNKYHESFPWNKLQEKEWKGYVLKWNELIQSVLIKNSKIKSAQVLNSSGINCCNASSRDINELFAAFLTKLGSAGLPNGMHQEGIISSDFCGTNTLTCNFQLVHSRDDLVRVCYPWLRVYKKNLPYEGEFPFIPDDNWLQAGVPIRRSNFSNNGYLDIYGNEWTWDTYHNDHWDVQHSNRTNDYTNVNVDGSLRDN
ncbi:hypothetical protein QUN95_004598 [Vibrio parahaemolyticus]|uniref:polymorphic toxin type 17 domain-containing protein n=1 Tax=Vibrio parahaemolyticus TaxID=670 RepID=UPI00112169DC|nr:polymorphic toxin type 17 domain-containing protein [Vibrio parahaemolyticus]EGR1757298.1 hypothetical protein [Vibrio parahaemolyticus]EHH1283324.1 hypothetical protein [Vibrio parahaemolyticus]EHK9069238.1 hypothetical protein [Vibrio parahaemolyticus]EIU6793097.1 hypothetical protein [Vibrio parahaemolyticus]EIY6181208.1 hypothetical protein [Vibrio parahaemolyticus]